MDILSIDFDIIMEPVIQYYNNLVPSTSWEEIQKDNPSFIIPNANLNHYNFLLSLLECTID